MNLPIEKKYFMTLKIARMIALVSAASVESLVASLSASEFVAILA